MNLTERLKKNKVTPRNIHKVIELLSTVIPAGMPTVEEILCFMYSMKKGGMSHLRESMSSTGGYILFEGRKIPCGTANFYNDYNSGKILYFENIQDVPEEIKEKGYQGYYKIAVDIKNFKQFIAKAWTEKSSEQGAKVISLTAQAFNKTWGF